MPLSETDFRSIWAGQKSIWRAGEALRLFPSGAAFREQRWFPAPSRRRACVVTALEISSSACWHSALLTSQRCGRAGSPVLGKGWVPEHALLLEKITPGWMLLAEAQNEVTELFLCHFWPAPKPIDTWNILKEEIIRAVVLSCYVAVLKFP